MAKQTRPLDELENIDVDDRADLEPGEPIACLLSLEYPTQVWMYCGKVVAVSDDGTLVLFRDELGQTTAGSDLQWLDPSDWLARWTTT